MNQDQSSELPVLRLRPARADDAAGLTSILHAAFEEYRGRLDPPAGVFHETAYTIREKMLEGIFIIASVGDVPAGCVFYQPASNYVYLGRLAVLPRYRKHGIARALVGYVERQAAVLQLPRVQLGARLAIPYLQAYYTRLGYHLVNYGTHDGYSEPTYIIMEKDLSADRHPSQITNL